MIKKVRKVVVHFKRSSTKNDTVLQKYVREEKGKELSLIQDVRTRWNSMLDMIERFVALKSCIQKALIDVMFQIKLEERDFNVLEEIVGVLTPIKLTVEALCRRDSNFFLASCSILIALYPNATRLLQPADVSAFKPLKNDGKRPSGLGCVTQKTNRLPLRKAIT